ncbi:MAG: PilZ domain-containing protein [Pseudomonadota bacterium]
MLKQKIDGERYTRMQLRAEVVLLRQGELWDSEVVDISASGMLVRRPSDWEGALGDEVSVELIVADRQTIPMFGKIVRYDDDILGVEYTHIPPPSEIPLWTLLGEFADAIDHQAETEA